MPLKVPKLHKLTRDLKPYLQDHFLLAVSGGLDSMALFALFLHFKKHFSLNFAVTYFHHGPSPSTDQLEYRFKAYQLVRSVCQENEIQFFCNYDGRKRAPFLATFNPPLSSENDFREARYKYFDQLKKDKAFDWIVLAHHCDDLFETRLIRLIRGVGIESLESMKFIRGDRMRPLLEFSKEDLKSYMQSQNGKWLEDTSNQDTDAFRNWVRNDWLLELEKKRPGSIVSFSRSLENLLQEKDSEKLDFSQFITEGALSVTEVLSLSHQNKIRVIAEFFRLLGVKNYGQSHIEEVIKRLDTSRKRLTFQLLGRRWKVDAGRMIRVDPA